MPLRILADENIPRPTVLALREAGHDVEWVHALAHGTVDPQVLALAQEQQRVLVTLDRDFGELAFKERLAADFGIILLRYPSTDPDALTARLVEVLAASEDWSGHFSVVEQDRVRMTGLPEAQ